MKHVEELSWNGHMRKAESTMETQGNKATKTKDNTVAFNLKPLPSQ